MTTDEIIAQVLERMTPLPKKRLYMFGTPMEPKPVFEKDKNRMTWYNIDLTIPVDTTYLLFDIDTAV
jgi:hypothetical protein